MAAPIFAARRQRFFDSMADGVAIFRAAPVFLRNGDVDHPYRQDTDFFFLTGFEEPDAYAVLDKRGTERRYTLFVRPADPDMEVRIGKRAGVDGAVQGFGADAAFPVEDFFAKLPELLTNRARLYLEFGRDAAFEGRVTAAIEALKGEARKNLCGPWEIVDPRTLLWEMRGIKTAVDVAALQTACDVTAAAFDAAMRACVPGMGEWELAAVLEFEFRRRSAARVGFETICACGPNATTLHYIRNDGRIEAGRLVLIDAGAEVGSVCADISRTFPANGRFTGPQRIAYDWVLRAQKAAIAEVRPGVTYARVHEAGLRVLCQGLVDMGVLKGDIDTIVTEGTYRPYFMHRIGHWLGGDVHDVGPYFVDGNSVPLRAGMVLTIEPGLYFSGAAPVPPEFAGLGIRIEDDVLVTEDGCRVLTSALPKEADEIEALMTPIGSWWKSLEPVSGVSEPEGARHPAPAGKGGRGRKPTGRGAVRS
jgi:Xaa-Pro aminopeptidase